MKRKISLAFLAFGLVISLFSGCLQEDSADAGESEITVYRLAESAAQPGQDLINAETIPLGEMEDSLHAALEAVVGAPVREGLKSAFPKGVNIISYQLDGGEIALVMSPEYLNITGMARTMANYCLTLTLCGLDEVNTVSTYVESFGAVSLGMTPDDVLLYDMETNPYERQIRLYFADSGGRYLTAEYRDLFIDPDVPIERYIMEELLRGAGADSLYSPIPEGTSLISISTQDGVCTVNLSEDFVSGVPSKTLDQRLAVYSIVNTLTTVADIDSVIIVSNETPITQYGVYDTSEPLARNERVIGPASSAKGESDLNLYLMVQGTDKLTAISCIAGDGYLGLESVAVALMSESYSEPGLSSVFPEDFTYNTVGVQNTVCYIDLPESFFEQADKMGTLEMAVASLVLTLTDVQGIDSVQLRMAGSAAIYDNYNFSARLYRDEALIFN